MDSVNRHFQSSKDGSPTSQISVTPQEKAPSKNSLSLSRVTSDILIRKWVLYTGPENKCEPLARTFQQWLILMVDGKQDEPFT